MRRALTLALALAVAMPNLAPAQSSRGRIPRRWIGAVVGAAITGTAAWIYSRTGTSTSSHCSSPRCVATVMLVGGAGAGFLIGRQFDQLYAMRYRNAPPMTVRGQSIPLSVVPTDIAARGGIIAAAGEGGVEILAAGERLERGDVRARGLRRVAAAVPDPATNRLLVATGAGLYGFALRGEQLAGGLLRPGDVIAVDVHGDHALVATDRGVDLARLVEDSLVGSAAPRVFPARIADVAWDHERGLAWVLTETALVALAVGDSGLADSLGAFPLFTAGRRLAILRDTIAVAAGEGGVFLLDVSDPRAPRQVAQWSGARFAYDVALGPRAVYLAAGPEGLYVLSPRADGSMTALGLARNLGFVAALDADGSDLYLIDRSGGLLRRIPIAN